MKTRRILKRLSLIKVILILGCAAGMLLLFVTAFLSDMEAISFKDIFVKWSLAVSLMGFCSTAVRVCNRLIISLNKQFRHRAKIHYINQKIA